VVLVEQRATLRAVDRYRSAVHFLFSDHYTAIRFTRSGTAPETVLDLWFRFRSFP
jgi:hypothetical protein